MQKNHAKTLANIFFVLFCAALLIFLWRAPDETTKKLPHDADHNSYFTMGKKEAEKHCQTCHNADNVPFPANHPPKNRCLFCHKPA